MRLRSIRFDLDGTPLNSAPLNLPSVQAAHDESGIRRTRIVAHDLIGPPPARTLISVLRDIGTDRMSEPIMRFTRRCDGDGYVSMTDYYTPPLPEESAMLQHLGGERHQDAHGLVCVDRPEDTKATTIGGDPWWVAFRYSADLGRVRLGARLAAPDQLLVA